MNALVGYTGFVGSNLYASGNFDAAYNSKNIETAFGTKPDLLVYAGLRAEKYLANRNPAEDLELVRTAEDNILRIKPRKLVLISTVDVFRTPLGVDENSSVETDGLHAYGYDRYMLECWVREHYPDSLIVRLPALFGKNLKKNFIYDYINVIPSMLKNETFLELAGREPLLWDYYIPLDNGFYKANVPDRDREELKHTFQRLGFTALNFTDSRSVYQFYDLRRLWKDISIMLNAEIPLVHMATEPVSVCELYQYLENGLFENEFSGEPIKYDVQTIHGKVFGSDNRYILNKNEILSTIYDFVKRRE